MGLFLNKTLVIISLALALNLTAASGAFAAYGESDTRTYNRTAPGVENTNPLFETPQYYEFSPQVSNWDEQNQHPDAWRGQYWDTENWNSRWTPQSASDNFFENGVFNKRYMQAYKKSKTLVKDGAKRKFFVKARKESVPVLELGPVFYRLSDLDQRRSLKLVVEQSGVLQHGYAMVVLLDWKTKEIIGTYSDQGMFLN